MINFIFPMLMLRCLNVFLMNITKINTTICIGACLFSPHARSKLNTVLVSLSELFAYSYLVTSLLSCVAPGSYTCAVFVDSAFVL